MRCNEFNLTLLIRIFLTRPGSVNSPIKHKAHELKVESPRQAVELNPTRGALLALTALAEVAVIPV